ncbi:1,4-dihydroxy-2-naphthoate octaprenyltransferase [Virgibacillus sp. MSP4-1]|nr:1,4-dihydroxy-2-naphthoate octaprenyltransferase [Virgibacillus sp. MSP4-1]
MFQYRYSWVQLFRPLTLSGTISPVIAGTALAAATGSVRLDIFLVMLLASLFVQSSVNILNDYFDFKNGQDTEKWIMPSKDDSEKTGPKHQLLPYMALTCILIAIGMGAWLAYQSSPWIAVVGAIGIVAGYYYSAGSHSLSSIGLGEITAALFLGPVTTCLAYVVQGHSLNLSVLWVSITFAVLISAMILSNNIRDMKKDETFRCTLAQRLGRVRASYLLILMLTIIYLWVLGSILSGVLPVITAISFLAIPVAGKLVLSYRPGAKRVEEIEGMKIAAIHHWVFGLLFSFGMWASIWF